MLWNSTLAVVTALGLSISAANMSSAQTVLSIPSYEFDGIERTWRLHDSRWGIIPSMLAGASVRLDECSTTESVAFQSNLSISSQRYDREIATILEHISECAPGAPPMGAEISADAWRYLTFNSDRPSVLERTRLMVFRQSYPVSDYDQTDWIYDSPLEAYRTAMFRWGPFQLEIGDRGCWIPRLLRHLNSDPSAARALDAFSDFGESAILEQLLTDRTCGPGADTRQMVEEIYRDFERKDQFSNIFSVLAEHAAVRREYDRWVLGPNGRRNSQIRYYYQLYETMGLEPTEIDFSFFLDHALDTAFGTLSRREATQEAINVLANRHRNSSISNARFRQIFANYLTDELPDGVLTQSGARPESFRRGRDTAYYIDGSDVVISDQERADWTSHSRLRPQNVGLSDNRVFYPCEYTDRTDCENLLPNGTQQ